MRSFIPTKTYLLAASLFFLGIQFLVVFSANAFPKALSTLVPSTDGRLYGTRYGTPDDGNGGGDGGSVFAISTNGDFQNIHSFQTKGRQEGANPHGKLLLASDGIFYGTTAGNPWHADTGTIFRVEPDGSITTLYSFSGGSTQNLRSGLIEGTDGRFYGTTMTSGKEEEAGVVYAFSPNAKAHTNELEVLHVFTQQDGSSPESELVQGTDGFLYGTTSYGGSNKSGVIFKISPSSGEFRVLKEFSSEDGINPQAGLVEGPNHQFYGTTYEGGAAGKGTIYQIDSNGNFSTLHSFNGEDGDHAMSRLVKGSDNFYYGTTNGGGEHKNGTIYKIDPSQGRFETVYNFEGLQNGTGPINDLYIGDDGQLYGQTSFGGNRFDLGLIYKFDLNSKAYTVLHRF